MFSAPQMQERPSLRRAQPAHRDGFVPAEDRRDLAQQVLHRIDQGVLILDGQAQVRWSNRSGMRALEGGSPLRLRDNMLTASRDEDAKALHTAIARCRDRGQCGLVALHAGSETSFVAIMPIDKPDGRRWLLCLLGRESLGNPLTLQWFAQSFELTNAESAVLRLLGSGLLPAEVARRHGVALSTVRTQIRVIREKTGARSIRSLLESLAKLPPTNTVLSTASGQTVRTAIPMPGHNRSSDPTTRSAA